MVVTRHRRIVGLRVAHAVLFIPVAIVVLRAAGVDTGCDSASTNRHSIVVIVELDVGQSGLRKRLCDEFALLILQVREVTSGFLLRKSRSLGQTLLVFTLDDLSNTLKQM